MASRRTSGRAGSGARSSARRSSSSGSDSNTMMFAGIGVVLVIVLIVMMSGGGDGDGGTTDSRTGGGSSSAAAKDETKPAASTSVPELNGSDRAGSEPKTPAPAIDRDRLARAEEHYAEGKRLWNEAQRARSAGKQDVYAEKTTAAYEAMAAWRELLLEYREWYTNADFEGWRIPGEYVALIERMRKPMKLYTSVHKLKQVR